MEDRLAAYRATKAKENSSIFGFGKGLFIQNRSSSKDRKCNSGNSGSRIRNAKSTESEVSAFSCSSDSNHDNGTRSEKIETSARSSEGLSTHSLLGGRLAEWSGCDVVLKLTLWGALFGVFISLGFGAIFVILTLFYIVYANMRGEGEKKPGEKSAYSVFNQNCERIHGTFTAEQFEREMLYGIGGAVR